MTAAVPLGDVVRGPDRPAVRPHPVAVLVGPMGAGKTTVGRELARLLRVAFIDSDAAIERSAGVTVPQLFARGGEAPFRALEAETVSRLLATHRGVLALGGGAPVTPAVRDALAGHLVVRLRIDADRVLARIGDSDRPLLAGADPAGRWREIAAARDSAYAAVAVWDVDTSHHDAGQLAAGLARRIQRLVENPAP